MTNFPVTALCLALTLAAVACGAHTTSVVSPASTPTQMSHPSTADSIDAVYSVVPSDPEGAPLSPLFAGRPEDRPAIERLALALDSAVVTGASARIAVNHRGRHLSIHFLDGSRLIVRQVLRCEAHPEIARMASGAGSCDGRYLPLADTWWIEGRGIVKSPELGLWWEDMPGFMAPIGSISVSGALKAGEPFSLTTCCWARILQSPTMVLSLVAVDDTEIYLGEVPATADFTEAPLTVPAHTPEGHYWLRVSDNSFSELVELISVQ